jgi:hypothetical protein
MVALLIISLFVLVAVLSVRFGADSRRLHDRPTDWPFSPRPRP